MNFKHGSFVGHGFKPSHLGIPLIRRRQGEAAKSREEDAKNEAGVGVKIWRCQGAMFGQTMPNLQEKMKNKRRSESKYHICYA